MKVYQFEFENPQEERRIFPVSYLNFNHGLRCFFSAIKDDWRIGSIMEVFIANKHPRRLIFRIESRPEGDLISDFRKCPLKENREYRFNFKTLELNEKDIDFLLSKVAMVIKGGNFLYLVPKKERRNFGFIETALRLKAKKQDSLIFVRHGNRFTFCNNFGGLKFKGVLIYGSLAKTIKNELAIYTFPELKKEVYNKDDAFALSINYVDNKVNFSLLKTTGNLI